MEDHVPCSYLLGNVQAVLHSFEISNSKMFVNYTERDFLYSWMETETNESCILANSLDVNYVSFSDIQIRIFKAITNHRIKIKCTDFHIPVNSILYFSVMVYFLLLQIQVTICLYHLSSVSANEAFTVSITIVWCPNQMLRTVRSSLCYIILFRAAVN